MSDQSIVRAALAADRLGGGGAVSTPSETMCRSSVLSSEAGMLGTLALLVAFATFGPLFSYWLGLALFAAAVGLGTSAILLAHRAGHSHRRNPHLIGRGYATVGAVTGWVALLVGSSYIGLVFLLLNPGILSVGLTLGVLALAIHAGAREGENALLRSLDRRTDTVECGRCASRVSLTSGRWSPAGWRCSRCLQPPWSVAQ